MYLLDAHTYLLWKTHRTERQFLFVASTKLARNTLISLKLKIRMEFSNTSVMLRR